MEKDLIKNSEFIISYFNNNNRLVTNLMIQKLMYFLEALYMVISDEDRLFKEEFYAWDFGPVNIELYNKYKENGSSTIFIDNVTIDSENERYIRTLFEMFEDFTTYDLVSLSHEKKSPWYEIYTKYNGMIPKNIIIDKKKTKEWFRNKITNGK